jgi:hypothetical protein
LRITTVGRVPTASVSVDLSIVKICDTLITELRDKPLSFFFKRIFPGAVASHHFLASLIDTAFHITVSGGSRKINRKRAQVLRSEHKGAFDEAGLHVKK